MLSYMPYNADLVRAMIPYLMCDVTTTTSSSSYLLLPRLRESRLLASVSWSLAPVRCRCISYNKALLLEVLGAFHAYLRS